MVEKPDQVPDGLKGFSPQTISWFKSVFPDGPTPTQAQAWSAIRTGQHVLLISPTGSGKTLAAFLWAIDSLISRQIREEGEGHIGGTQAEGVSVLYVSPMKALGSDVARNLQSPLEGIAREYETSTGLRPRIRLGVRSGDTDARERRSLAVHPPDILVTTPESLYLILTSKARKTLRGVQTVIIDEVHALAGNKRGAHLALSLERLDALVGAPVQRIGLSATVKPPRDVAGFLGGADPVITVEPRAPIVMELGLLEPLTDMNDLDPGHYADKADHKADQEGTGSAWPAVEQAILDQILAHRTTLVFVNSRGLAERLTARLNDLYASNRSGGELAQDIGVHYDSSTGSTSERVGGWYPEEPIAMAHHGSVSKERRRQVEEELKSGRLRCVVATSSLELGIDMGSVDLVIQVNAPPSVSSGLQRVGRADHQVGAVSHALLIPLTRRQILLGTASLEGMRQGDIEPTVVPRNPLDVLAQQTVAAASMEDLDQEAWYKLVLRAAPFSGLDVKVYRSVLAMLSGEFSSGGLNAFRPLLIWDKMSGRIRARPGAQRVAVTSGGTIPDRGSYSVVMPEEEAGSKPRRVGELDEEMVYESRKGDIITLGTTSWLIRGITRDQVVVVPAPNHSSRLPFWHGDGLGRNPGFGFRLGALTRDLTGGLRPASHSLLSKSGFDSVTRNRLQTDGLDENSINNLADFLAAQVASTGLIPNDQTLVVEHCPNEEGDMRLILHSPYGRRVHEPWALAISARLADRYGYDGSVWAGDDGIIVQIPQEQAELDDKDVFLFSSDQIDRSVREHLVGSALFQACFRQCAARSLYMPRMEPGRRVPLWQQRLRASQLLDAALKMEGFPLVIETMRECLQDKYDMPALRYLMGSLESGRVRMVQIRTEIPSPMASDLLFGYLGTFIYQYDMPKAERNSALLSVDSEVLETMVGQVDMTALLDQEVVNQVEEELQRLTPQRRVRGAEGLVDLLRTLGPLSQDQIMVRTRSQGEYEQDHASSEQVQGMLASLVSDKRVEPIQMAGQQRWIWSQDRARMVAVLGRQALEPEPDGHTLGEDSGQGDLVPPLTGSSDHHHLDDLFLQYAATHGPFSTESLAGYLGTSSYSVRQELEFLQSRGQLLHGTFPLPTIAPLQDKTGSGQTADGHGSTDLTGQEGGDVILSDRLHWLDPGVFRIIRARSLSKARKATKPVSQEAYSAFLLEYQGLGSIGREPNRGEDGLLDVIGQLEGLYLPANLWESAVFPSRVFKYEPSLLDNLLSSGQVVWLGGQENSGQDPLEVLSFYLAEDMDDLLPLLSDCDTPNLFQGPVEGERGSESRLIAILSSGGAYRFEDLVNRCSADPAAHVSNSARNQEVLASALWNLVRAGQVTNISLGPVRKLLQGGNRHRTRSVRPLRSRFGGLAYRPARSSSGIRPLSVKAAEQGLWILARSPDRMESRDQPSQKVNLLKSDAGRQASQRVCTTQLILNRYGLVSPILPEVRESPGGFSALYPVCHQMEEAGQLVRGLVVRNFGGAQFASRQVIESLRQFENEEKASDQAGSQDSASLLPVVMDVTDPANLYGGALDWPQPAEPSDAQAAMEPARPIRRSGNLLVQVGGRALLYAAPRGHRILVFQGVGQEQMVDACHHLALWLQRSGSTATLFRDMNGVPLGRHNLYTRVMGDAGFTSGPSGMRLY